MSPLITIVIAAAAAIIGYVVAISLARRADKKRIDSAQNEAKRILAEAEKEAKIKQKEAMLEGREAWMQEKAVFDKEMDQRRRSQAVGIPGTMRSGHIEQGSLVF